VEKNFLGEHDHEETFKDLVTGWGSPTGQKLINALAGVAQ
jgi:hypothetical protein